MNHIFDNAFSEPRQAADRCLVEAITRILSDLNHPNPSEWTTRVADLPGLLAAAPKLQRFLINRHWRIALGLQQQDTSRERYHLFDDGDSVDDWLFVFKTSVAPTIVTLHL